MGWLKRFMYGIKDYAQDRLNDGAAYLQQQANEWAQQAQNTVVNAVQSGVNYVQDQVQGAIGTGADWVGDQLGLGGSKTTTPTATQPPAAPPAAVAPAATPPAGGQAPTNTPNPETGTVTAPPSETTGTSGTTSAPTTNPATRPLTQVEINRMEHQKAWEHVLEVWSKPFSYSKKSSPLYSILEQQYAKQAEKAAGQAYARAVANTGGYGSSYANLTAEEARRQTMEGFSDQQMALYQSARDEFLQERQSAVDWYNQTSKMYQDAKDEELVNGYNFASSMWNGENEDEVRSALQAEGYQPQSIDSIIRTMKSGDLDDLRMESETDKYKTEAAYKDATNDASGTWTDADGNTVSWKSPADDDALRTYLQGKGYDNSVIEQVISKKRQAYVDQLKEDDYIRESTSKEQFKNGKDKALDMWFNGSSNEEIEAYLKDHYDAGTVNDVMYFLRDAQNKQSSQELEADQYEYTESYNNAWKDAGNTWTDAAGNTVSWKSPDDNDALRAHLASLGYESDVIEAVIEKKIKKYNEGLSDKQSTEELEYTEDYNNAWKDAAGIWKGPDDEKTVRDTLASAGYSADVIDDVVDELKREYAEDMQVENIIRETTDADAARDAKDDAAALWAEGKSNEEIREELLKKYDATVVQDIMSWLYQTRSTNDYNAAMSMARGIWVDPKTSEASVRADLLEAGYDPALVEQIITDLKTEYADRESVNATLKQQEYADNLNKAYGEATSVWKSPADDGKVRDALKAAGYEDKVIDAVIKTLKDGYLASLETENAITEEQFQGEVIKATNEAYGIWNGENGEEVKAALEKTYSKPVVDSVLSSMGIEVETETEEKISPEDASAYLLENFDTYNENTMRALLKSLGASDEVINSALENVRGVFKGAVTDTSSGVTDMSSAIEYKGTLDAGLKNNTLTVEEYDAEISKNSKIIVDEVTKNLETPSKLNYKALGFTKAEWDGMDDGEKKLATFEALGRMAVDGTITRSDYDKMLSKDLGDFFSSSKYKNSNYQLRDAANKAIEIQNLYDDGYLLQDQYVQLLYMEIAPKFENTDVFNGLLHAVKTYGKSVSTYVAESAIVDSITDGNRAIAAGKTYQRLTGDQKEMLLNMAIFMSVDRSSNTSDFTENVLDSRPSGNSTVTETTKR